MDESPLQFALKAFVTLFVVVDPLGVAPSFVALTNELGTVERQKTLARALIIAFGVTLFFLLGGHILLFYLGVTEHAFNRPSPTNRVRLGKTSPFFHSPFLCFRVRERSRPYFC